MDRYYDSGILEVGSGNVVVDIKPVNKDKPILLSNLLALAVDDLGIKIGEDEVIFITMLVDKSQALVAQAPVIPESKLFHLEYLP